jgi:type II secretory pathway pseudopilin PulG
MEKTADRLEKRRIPGGRRRGFSVVNVVASFSVVAILAATAVPALAGYIGNARELAAVQSLRAMHQALQIMVMQDFVNGHVKPGRKGGEIGCYGPERPESGPLLDTYIEYERTGADRSSFSKLLAYLGTDTPPGFPADGDKARLRFLVSPADGSIAALDYVTVSGSGAIVTRTTWRFDGGKDSLSDAAAHLDASGYTARVLEGRLTG